MDAKYLEASLEIRPVTNIALNGDLIELDRGTEDIVKRLGTNDFQQTLHFFHPGHRAGGNHCHLGKKEVMTVLLQPIRFHLSYPNSRTGYSIEIPKNHKVTLQPGIAHALFYTGSELSLVFEQASLVFNPLNPKNDTAPYQIIDFSTGRPFYS